MSVFGRIYYERKRELSNLDQHEPLLGPPVAAAGPEPLPVSDAVTPAAGVRSLQ